MRTCLLVLMLFMAPALFANECRELTADQIALWANFMDEQEAYRYCSKSYSELSLSQSAICMKLKIVLYDQWSILQCRIDQDLTLDQALQIIGVERTILYRK